MLQIQFRICTSNEPEYQKKNQAKLSKLKIKEIYKGYTFDRWLISDIINKQDTHGSSVAR